MQISPRCRVDKWQQLTFSREDEGQTAIDILDDRIRGRFLEPLSRIKQYTYAGFAVMALDCLLIETLQQFREGLPETPRNQSEDYFARFLTETSFGNYFDRESAKKFYKQIRCGILHQAETKGDSRIVMKRNTPLVSYSDDRKSLVINRRLFHEQLVREYESYVAKLRDPSNSGLRTRFRRKMNHICRVGRHHDEVNSE